MNGILFKKVFGNSYLKRIIFDWIPICNIEAIKAGSRYPIEDPRRKYDQIDFKYIIDNGLYSVLFDIYKGVVIDKEKNQVLSDSSITSRAEFTNEQLIYGLKQLLIDMNKLVRQAKLNGDKLEKSKLKEFLFKFYLVNKTTLHGCYFKDLKIEIPQDKNNYNGYSSTKITNPNFIISLEDYSILQLSVYCSNYQFLKIVYQNHFIKLPKDQLKLEWVLDWSLIQGDLKILKYLFNVVKVEKYDKSLALENACQSESLEIRESIIRFLIDGMNYPTFNFSSGLSIGGTFKFLQIDHYNLFSKFQNFMIVKDTSFLNVDKLPFSNLLNLSHNLYSSNSNYKSHLDYITSISNIQLISNGTIYKFKDLKCISRYSKSESKSSSFVNGIKSIFKSSSKKGKEVESFQDPCIDQEDDFGNVQFNLVNFKKFEIEREVKRLYIYYQICNLNENNQTNFYLTLRFLFQFIDKYKEFGLLDQLIYPTRYNYLKSTFLYESDVQDPENYFMKLVTPIYACKHTDIFIHLFNTYGDHFNWNNDQISLSIVRNNDLILLKFINENSIFIKPSILDSFIEFVYTKEILEYLFENTSLKFRASSFYTAIVHSNHEMFEYYLQHLNSHSDVSLVTVCNIINSSFDDIKNLKFLFTIQKLIDNETLDPKSIVVKGRLAELLKPPIYLER